MSGIEARQTARLRLRRITLADVPALVELQSDPRTTAHRPGGTPTATEAEQTVREFVAGWQEHGIGYWCVELAGRIVGVVGVRPLPFHGRACWNLYYRFSPDVWGTGVATEAVQESVVVAQQVDAARPVVARTRPGNDPAIRLAQRAGLRRRPDLDTDGFLVLVKAW